MSVNMEVLKTETAKIKEEVSDVLNGNDIVVDNFKYVDYTVTPVVLQGTIFDVKNLLNEKAKVREGFYVDNARNEIKLPNFFSKLNGVIENKKEWKKVVADIDKDSSVFYDFSVGRNLLKMLSSKKRDEFTKLIKYKNASDKAIIEFFETFKTTERISSLDDPLIKYSLNTYIYTYVIDKLDDFFQSCKYSHRLKYDDMLMAEFLLNVLFMPKSIVDELNNWDFTSYVPRIVIHDDTAKLTGRPMDFLLVDFYNYIGMDVVILTPTGKSSIEEFDFELNTGYINTIVLDRFAEPEKKTREEKKFDAFMAKVCIAVAALFIFMLASVIMYGLGLFDRFAKEPEPEYTSSGLTVDLDNLDTLGDDIDSYVNSVVNQYVNGNSSSTTVKTSNGSVIINQSSRNKDSGFDRFMKGVGKFLTTWIVFFIIISAGRFIWRLFTKSEE